MLTSAGEVTSPAPPTLPTRVRAHVEDVVGALVAILFGLTSLFFPFGRDQGLYYYVGREWALRGSIPYRDLFDHKTPGIYVVHALTVRVFGEHQWGIRVVDLLAVLSLGVVVALLSVRRGANMAPGTVGRSLTLTALLHYGFLNWWDSGQSEIHFALLGCLTILLACRFEAASRTVALFVGLTAALALIMKPPALWLVLFALGIVGARLREEKAPRLAYATTLGLIALGAAVPVCATLAYFASKGALGAMRDIVVGANGYYVAHEHAKNPVADGIDGLQGYLAYYSPLSQLFLGGGLFLFFLARRENDAARAARYRLALALFGACTACVASQMKFYLLHWTVVIPGFVLLALEMGTDLSTALTTRAEARPLSARTARAAPWVLVLLAFFFSGAGRRFVEQQLAVARYLRGEDSRQWYLGRYSFAPAKFDYAESEWVADYVRERTTEDEPVLVRGFQPEVYAALHRRYPGRFFWTQFLVNPNRAYRREAYLAEDLEAFQKAKPRYVIARHDTPEVNVDHPDYYLPLGYRVEVEHGHFVILKRLP